MGNVIIKLSRDRSHDFLGGSGIAVVEVGRPGVAVVIVVPILVGVVVERAGTTRLAFPDGVVYLGEVWVKAVGDAIGLNVSCGSQETERVNVDVDRPCV
jgi:hypothetical protein